MVRFHRTIKTVREATALERARPAYAAGIRAAVATVAPLVVDQIFGLGGGTWMSLGGFSGALSDRGGSYRTRAGTMGILTLVAACTVALGSLAGSRLAFAIPVTFLVAILASLARVWGSPGISIGSASLSSFVIALAFPVSHPREALVRGAFVVVGGAGAMLIALVLWPLRPYRPARVAVAGCYRALADYVDDVARGFREAGVEGATVPAGSARVRAALEHARAVFTTLRRGRPGSSGRGERLLVLGEVADQLFGHVVAVGDTIMSIRIRHRDPAAQRALLDALAALATHARAVALAVEAEKDLPPIPRSANGAALRAIVSAREEGELGDVRVHYLHAASILDRSAQFADTASRTVEAVNGDRPLTTHTIESVADELDEPVPLLETLGAILTPESVILRYATRVAVVTTAAVALASLFDIAHGYWLTITVIVILQPYTGATTHRALQRVIGTVVGGILTAALGALFHDPRAILVLSFIFAAACVALMPLNYAVYSIFLTPTFVLLAEASAGDWHLAKVRVFNTVLGGVLALAGSRLLWPSPEWTRFPGYMAAAMRANRDYLNCVVRLFGDRSEQAGQQIRAARRCIGLASNNAEESFQRLLGEYEGPASELEALMTLITYTRRFTASTAALALARHSGSAARTEPLQQFARAATVGFDDLASALVADRRPAPLPEPVDEPPPLLAGPPLVQARVDRLGRQLRMLQEGTERWASRASAAIPLQP